MRKSEKNAKEKWKNKIKHLKMWVRETKCK